MSPRQEIQYTVAGATTPGALFQVSKHPDPNCENGPQALFKAVIRGDDKGGFVDT